MPLLLGDGLKFSQELCKVVRGGIGDFVLEVEEDALGGGDSNSILSLILFNKLPKRIGPVVFLERNSHNLILLNLCPLNPIYL